MVSPVSATSHGSPLRSQAQPRKLSSSRDRVEFASGVKRETSFHDVYPCSTKRPIEIMTSEEKAAKAAQIRARPTRKELFDSNQRLAHVRRYRRQDIHDESDGAWEPESVGVRKKANRWKGDTLVNDCGRSRSLHEVFNLPANAIPMNNGNELAFRDGTLVSHSSVMFANRRTNYSNRSMAGYHDHGTHIELVGGWELYSQSCNSRHQHQSHNAARGVLLSRVGAP